MTALLAFLLTLVSALRAGEPPEAELKRKEAQAREAVEDYKRSRAEAEEEERRGRRGDLSRLQRDLRYVAEEVDREELGASGDLQAVSEGCLERLEYLKTHGRLDERLYDPQETPPDPDKPIARLEALCRGLPRKTYASEYSRELMRAVATELREAAGGSDEDAILERLREHLVLPDQQPGEEDAFSSLALFPIDLTLAQFKKLGAIRIFLVKHRLRRPPGYAKTAAKDLVAGKHHVQIGVELEGEVNRGSGEVDLDYTFNIGDLHLEMTPEWRLAHPDLPKPKKGQRVRVRGWTYYDSFHKAEHEYDPSDPVLGTKRVTLWEVHPVQDVEILP